MNTNDSQDPNTTKSIDFKKSKFSINKTMKKNNINDLRVELPKFMQNRKSTGTFHTK